METIRLTTAQAVVKFLNAQYISFEQKEHRFVHGIFTIFGHGNVLGLGQALAEDPGELVVYQGRNEQGMAHVATGFAKQALRKQIMACTSSVGPGAANMITAAATATANQIPLLLLPGDVFATRQPDPVLQQIEQTYDLSISTNDAFRAVSKYWDRVTRPEQLMSALINAFRVLTSVEDTGAVTICLPQDVQAEAWDFPTSFFEKRVHIIDQRIPSQHQLEQVAEMIRQSKKPLIIAGGGVRYAEAGNELLAFAETHQIPVAETQAGKSAIVSSERLNVGGIGVTGNRVANTLAKEADLIIGIGTRFTDFTTGSKSLVGQTPLIAINASPFHAQKLDATPVIADAKLAIKQLGQLLEGYTAQHEQLDTYKEQWEQELERLKNQTYQIGEQLEIAGQLDEQVPDYIEALQTTMTQTSAFMLINEKVEKDAIIVGAAGSLPGDMQRLWKTNAPNTYHMEYGYSCMGYEVAAALGAKIFSPEQEVYAMVGDGSFQMLHSEFVTSLQEQKKINILLFDNAGFGCINNLQMGNGMPSYKTEFRYREGNDHHGSVMAIDYAKIAEGYGAKTFTVHTLEQLESALAESRKSTVSTLIDIKVLPKTMSDGYDAWWHVGVAEVTKSESIQQAYKDNAQQKRMARSY